MFVQQILEITPTSSCHDKSGNYGQGSRRGDHRRLGRLCSIATRRRSMSDAPKSSLQWPDSCGTSEIMRRSGKARPVVWRWQARFMAKGVEGLTRDNTRAVSASNKR